MTKFILHKKIQDSSFTKMSYRLFIIFYSIYMAFSSQVFALQVEAPLGSKSFKEIYFPSEEVKDEIIIDPRIEKIAAFYNRYDLPLAANAADFIRFADFYEIDWRLVAAIGMIESTGGKNACSTAKYSAFGWGSCKINFDSYADSIDVISRNLAGKNPNTAQYYAGKDIRGILESYNPPHIVADYADQVMKQMEIIDNQ